MYRASLTLGALLVALTLSPAVGASASGTPATFCPALSKIPLYLPAPSFGTSLPKALIYEARIRPIQKAVAYASSQVPSGYSNLMVQENKIAEIMSSFSSINQLLKDLATNQNVANAKYLFKKYVMPPVYSETSNWHGFLEGAIARYASLCASPTTSVPPTTPTTTPEPTTVPTTPPVTVSVVAKSTGFNINTAAVQWTATGLSGIYRAALYTYKGHDCTTRIHSVSSKYNPMLNVSTGRVVSTGRHFYYPIGQYSGYVVVIANTGTTQSPCVYLGRI